MASLIQEKTLQLYLLCLSLNKLLFPEILTLAALGPQHISADVQCLSGHIWTSPDSMSLSSLSCFPNSHPWLFTLATPAKKNGLNEKAKSIRKSQLSAKRPLISRKFKEHRSERGCGAFPTPPQQCVRLWHVRVKPQTQARCQGSCFLRAEQSPCPAGCWGGSCWWRSSSITANNCNQTGESSPRCFQPELFSAKEREWGLISAQRYNWTKAGSWGLRSK